MSESSTYSSLTVCSLCTGVPAHTRRILIPDCLLIVYRCSAHTRRVLLPDCSLIVYCCTPHTLAASSSLTVCCELTAGYSLYSLDSLHRLLLPVTAGPSSRRSWSGGAGRPYQIRVEIACN